MNEFMTAIVLLEGFIFTWLVARRISIFSPPAFFIGFMTADFAIFAWIHFSKPKRSDFAFTAMPWPDFSSVYLDVVILYSILIFIGFLAALCYKNRTKIYKSSFITIQRSFYKVLNIKIRTLLLFLLALLGIVIEVVHLSEINLSNLWENSVYQLIGQPETAGVDSLVGRYIHFVIRPLGLLFLSVSIFLFFQKDYYWSIQFFILSVYPFLLSFAQNSRWAPLYLFLATLLFIFFSRKRVHNIFLEIISLLIGSLVFIKVLVGRNTPFQGLAGTDEIFRIILQRFDYDLTKWAVGFILNIFQGGQNIANSMLLDPYFPEIYKILSFSPTLSSFDNYSLIRKSYGVWIVRSDVRNIVPMNSYAEAYLFGFFYFLVLIIIILLYIYYTTKLFMSKSIIGFIFTIFFYYITFMLSQYEIRWVVRLIYLLLFFEIFVDKLVSTYIKITYSDKGRTFNKL